MLSIKNSIILIMSVSVNVFTKYDLSLHIVRYLRWSFLLMEHSLMSYCYLSLYLSGEIGVDKLNVLML
jgi:hypothetical protein